MLVSDLIYRAFRLARILPGPNQQYSDDDSQDALKIANGMIDAWKTERTLVYAVQRAVFTLIPGKGSESNPYTIGLNGQTDFRIERPRLIQNASYILNNTNPNVEVPLEVLNDQQYQALSPKDMTGPIPTRLYYRPTIPNGTIILWAIPNDAQQICIYAWVTLNQFLSLDQEVFLPDGYQEAIEGQLAIRLATQFPESNMTPMAIALANQALGKIRTINAPQWISQVEGAMRGVSPRDGHYNIFSNRTT